MHMWDLHEKTVNESEMHFFWLFPGPDHSGFVLLLPIWIVGVMIPSFLSEIYMKTYRRNYCCYTCHCFSWLYCISFFATYLCL